MSICPYGRLLLESVQVRQTEKQNQQVMERETERESLREIHFKELAPTIVKAC